MKVNDVRGKTEELGFDDLEAGGIYVSSRFQKYMIYTQDDFTICLESGERFDWEEHNGDVFTKVDAVLQIS